MKNMKVKNKLLSAFIMAAVMVAVAGIAGIIGLNTLSSNETMMYEQAVSTNNCTLLRHNIQEQRAACHGAGMKEMLDLEFESEFEEMNALNLEFNSLIAILEEKISLPENKARLANAKNAYAEYSALRDSFMEAVRSGEKEILIKATKEISTPIETVVTNLEAISQSAITVVNDKAVADGKTANSLIVLLIALVVLSIAVALFFAFYISGLISKPLDPLTTFMSRAGSAGDITITPVDTKIIGTYAKNKDEIGQVIASTANFINHMQEVGDVLERIADGDLTVELAPLSDDDTMGRSLQKMTKNLNSMFGEIHASASQVSIGSKQIANGAQSLAQGSTEQASSIEELSASINKISEQTMQNAEIAKEAAKLSETIKRNAEKGSTQMDQMVQAVKDINNASNQISKVIKVIDDIAFQTNILALNAAVEAARAGQHGKGFAVVAEEVRNLAAKSAEAAKDTGGLIENSIGKANLGLGIATETSASLKETVKGINYNAEIVAQIALSSDEQASAIAQINTGLDQVAQVVQQNSATAEESAAASEEMSGQSHMLEQLISQFKLRDANSQPPSSFAASSKKILAMPAMRDFPLTENHSAVYGKY